jgi:DNA-binding transcriptional regulator LsrR (DeoR family)
MSAQWIDALIPAKRVRRDHSPMPLEALASLRYEPKTAVQVATELGKHPDVVRRYLARARDLGLVETVGVEESTKAGGRGALWMMTKE